MKYASCFVVVHGQEANLLCISVAYLSTAIPAVFCEERWWFSNRSAYTWDRSYFLLWFSRSVVSSSLRTPWTAARQAFLSITDSRSLLKLMSIESVMPSNHLILCRPLLLQPSIFPSIRVFSSESALHIKWSKYWRFSFSISPSSK